MANTFTLRSISDDDLCSDCKHCTYNPGESSGCRKGWPGTSNPDGYVIKCDVIARIEKQDDNWVIDQHLK